ncbi:MAG: outer membrane protein transport protein [Myxococcaceae bacterium]|nr:outer membrane protein transport protein [Myxococcaceae bacterium]
MKRIVATVAAVLAIGALRAHAGGFALGEQDAASTGRGGTGTAALEGAASVHYNPAHLSRVFSITGALGGTAIAPFASAKAPGGGQAQSTLFGLKTPPHVYAAYGNGQWGAGIGVNTPFGGGVRWPDDFRGRYEVIEQNLQVFGIYAGAAYQITPHLSVGLSGILYRGALTLEKRVDFVDSDGTALIGGAGTAFSAQAGLSYAPAEAARLGLTARLPATVPIDGRAHFSNVPPSFDPLLQDQDIHTSVALPARIALGSAFYFDSLRLFADVDYTLWSAFDRLKVDFAKSDALNVDSPQNWTNAFGVHLGVEKDFTDVATIRGGAFFEQKAAPADTLSPSSPDSDRIGLSVGAGRDFGIVRGDVAYMYVMFSPRASEGSTAFPAEYNASAHLLSLTFRFSTPPGVASKSADTSDNRELVTPSQAAPHPTGR